MAPGVLGNTGVESGEMAEGVIAVINPAAVVAIDALRLKAFRGWAVRYNSVIPVLLRDRVWETTGALSTGKPWEFRSWR